MSNDMLIGEICRRSKCTPRTIRHYQAKGLINPVAETAGGHKLYDKEAVFAVRKVKLLKQLGHSLTDIRQILHLTKSGDTQHRRLADKLRKMLAEILAGMDYELNRLSSARNNIFNLLENTQKCDSCNSPDCGDCKHLKNLRTLGMFE